MDNDTGEVVQGLVSNGDSCNKSTIYYSFVDIGVVISYSFFEDPFEFENNINDNFVKDEQHQRFAVAKFVTGGLISQIYSCEICYRWSSYMNTGYHIGTCVRYNIVCSAKGGFKEWAET